MTSSEVSVPAETLTPILTALNTPFWDKADFWIGVGLGLAGVVFSWAAFVQAKRAVQAAKAAGRAVKFQTITIELTEASEKLNAIDWTLGYEDARHLLNEVMRRSRRYTAPFVNHPHLKDIISRLRGALDSAQTSLNDVRPTGPADEAKAPYAVYNAMENSFSQINGLIADLLGLLEGETQNFGDDDGDSTA